MPEVVVRRDGVVRIVRTPEMPKRVVRAGTQGPPGPQGPPGVGNAGTVEIAVTTPSANWVLPIPAEFGRRPSVAVYLTSGELVLADVAVDATHVSVTFATPTAGSAVLT